MTQGRNTVRDPTSRMGEWIDVLLRRFMSANRGSVCFSVAPNVTSDRRRGHNHNHWEGWGGFFSLIPSLFHLLNRRNTLVLQRLVLVSIHVDRGFEDKKD